MKLYSKDSDLIVSKKLGPLWWTGNYTERQDIMHVVQRQLKNNYQDTAIFTGGSDSGLTPNNKGKGGVEGGAVG